MPSSRSTESTAPAANICRGGMPPSTTLCVLPLPRAFRAGEDERHRSRGALRARVMPTPGTISAPLPIFVRLHRRWNRLHHNLRGVPTNSKLQGLRRLAPRDDKKAMTRKRKRNAERRQFPTAASVDAARVQRDALASRRSTAALAREIIRPRGSVSGQASCDLAGTPGP